MRRDDFGFKRHAELFEYVCRVFHNRPVGVTAHEDADDGGCVVHVFPLFNGYYSIFDFVIASDD